MNSSEFFSHKQQYVREHLENTSVLSRKFAEKIGLGNVGELIGLLHDFGKYSEEFQGYIKSACGIIDSNSEAFVDSKDKKGRIDHSSAGAQYIWRQADPNKPVTVYLAQIIALCIASHHGGLIDCILPDGEDWFAKRINKDPAKTHIDEAVDRCDGRILKRIDRLFKQTETLRDFIAVMKCVTDVASLTIRDYRAGFLTRFLFSCLIDADRTDTVDSECPEKAMLRNKNTYPAWDEFIDALDKRLSKFLVRNRVDEIRRDVSLACKKSGVKERGIYSLTVPTGGGKTLASLRFALEHARKHDLKRIVFVIPYTTIIDQNADEVRKVFKDLSGKYKTELVLEHHSNLTPDEETLQTKILSENWDASIVYITTVQLLESLFSGGTRGVRRMHQLAESVIVFDEIQTLPVRLVHLFNNAMNSIVDFCGSSVVLCTATQPCLNKVCAQKGAIEIKKEHEIMPDVKILFSELKRVEVVDAVKTGGWSPEEVAQLAKEELQRTGSVLIVVNTKRAAKELFELCQQADVVVYHLSTDMCPAHRIDILEKVKMCLVPDTFQPMICVSTQLIEAGVDVDFGSVIRYLAGLDSIAQAAGRCNRNGLREKGRVTIVNPISENLGMLKDMEAGREKTYRVLNEYRNNPEEFNNDLLCPDAMDRYFQYYFFDRASKMDYPVSAREFGHSDTLLRILSTNNLSIESYKIKYKKPPVIPLRQSFKSAAKAFRAIDSETQGIIVPYGEGEDIISGLCASSDISREFALMKSAQRFSVNCFRNMIDKLGIGEAGALHNIQGSGILCLKSEHYSKDYGVSVERVMNQSTGFLNG